MSNAKKMKATLPKEPAREGENHGDKRELTDAISMVAMVPGRGMCEVITIRCYMGRSSRSSVVYASVWINGPSYGKRAGMWTSGNGSAGGGGYCKRSAAIGDAFRSADVKLSHSINGRGMSAVRDACEAIGRAMGLRRFLIVEH
jgi:hypothetical protein